MNTKYVFTAVAIIIVLVIAFFAWGNNQDSAQNTDTAGETTNTNTESAQDQANTESEATPATNTATPPAVNEPTVDDTVDTAVFEIAYDGKAFSPSQLTIKKGDIVVFINNSGGDFWPASGPHPEHTNYPEFDPKKRIAAGGKYQFQFDKVGAWPFHDHLNSSVFGKITVQ
jgi:plastocyanin